MAGSDLDLKRLRRDVAKRQASRPADLAPGGRPATGSMAVVRQHLVQLDALRAEGATWAEIAAGLAEQGVTQNGGHPITAKRLTALVTLVRKADARRAAKAAERRSRSDTVKIEPDVAVKSKPGADLKLSPELTRLANAKGEPLPTEGDLRRAAFDKHAHLFKKD